jgi:superfamily II DNA/RNA helicase
MSDNKWNSSGKNGNKPNLRDIMQEEQAHAQEQTQKHNQRRKVDITREVLTREDNIPSAPSSSTYDNNGYNGYNGNNYRGNGNNYRGNGNNRYSSSNYRNDNNDNYNNSDNDDNYNNRGEFSRPRYANQNRNMNQHNHSSAPRKYYDNGSTNGREQSSYQPRYRTGVGGHHNNRRRGDAGFRTDPDAGYVCRQTEDDAKLLLIEPVDAFEDIGLPDEIVRGIYTYGFEHPSMIQKSAVRPVIAGYDIIAQAQSGTGKTAAFCMGSLGRVDRTINKTQVIVLSHTAELALQVYTVFTAINKYYNARINLCCKKFEVAENIDLLLGHLTLDDECNAVKKEFVDGDELLVPHLIIGTPGRVIDMIKQRAINTENMRLLVLDEADELLSSGFTDQIKTIMKNMPPSIQVALFSATMNGQFFKLTEKFMRDPVNILIKNEELTLDGIKQYYINTQKNEYKFDTLCDLYSILTISQAIIYCNNQQSVDYLTRKMTENNFAVSCIHGGNDIVEREKTMREFRTGATKVLIATDLIGRGIDVQQVSVVINFDIPPHMESYIHRIGRSGRHGRKGVAINFVTDYDKGRIGDLERFYSTEILPLPENLVI